MALVSNAFLLLNMTKRVRFSIAQPITIVGWYVARHISFGSYSAANPDSLRYISAICLLSLNATAAGPLMEGLDNSQDYVWSQAFFYGIWAAILYFVVASLMAVTFWGASSGHYAKDFNLTPSQRTLMLQTIMFLMYLLLGALVFSQIENWRYLDAVYWANVTLFTIGFGDFAASTNLGRALLLPYSFVGVISLGLVISSIRSMILERGRRRLDARMEEKKRRRIIRTMTKKGHDEILSPIERGDGISTWDEDHAYLPRNEFDRRRTEFLLMRKIQQQASIRRKWMAMAVSTSVWIVLWLVGAVIFLKCERPYQPTWTYFDGFYFCFVSFTTIGYGDRAPQSNAGKSFFVFWSLLALPTMTILISNAGDTVVKFVKDATIRLGAITILPGEEGFTGNVKYVTNRATLGRMFKESATPAQLREVHQHKRLFVTADASRKSTDVEKQHQNGSSGSSGSVKEKGRETSKHKLCVPNPPPGRASLSHVRDRLGELPTGTEFHLLLVKEIQAVFQHLNDEPPRRYSFEEWAWYLGLIGEDERDPGTHRKVTPNVHHKRHHHKKSHHHHHRKNKDKAPGPKTDASAGPGGEGEDPLKWSWVGNRSPLMGGQEESAWILEKLTERLQESLWETRMDEEDVDL